MLVKICGITNEEDARIAVEAGAGALGFNFYDRSPRYITPEKARRIVESVPGAYLKVGVFVNATEEYIESASREVPLDVTQLHGSACRSPVRSWRAIVAGEFAEAIPEVEAYLIDSPSAGFGGSGRNYDWSLAASFPYPKIIAGGLEASNVADAIRATSPWGVDACSRLESKPGKKDAKRVREFVAAALAAASRE